MDQGIAIEGFRPSDADRLRRLTRMTTGVAHPAELFAAVAETQARRLLVARDKRTGNAVGLAMAARPPGGNDMFLLAVEPKLHGKAVRKELLASIEETLVHDGERGLAVEVPAPDREMATFLEREGFRVLDVAPAPSPNEVDRYVMGKRFGRRARALL